MENKLDCTLDQLRDLPGKKVFCNGVWDVLHIGHISTLTFAKSKGDVLIVGVNNDSSAARLKPGRVITPLVQRFVMLASLECVDYVVSFVEDTPLEIIQTIQPDVLVKGGDYALEEIVGSGVVPEVYRAPYIPGVSSSLLRGITLS